MDIFSQRAIPETTVCEPCFQIAQCVKHNNGLQVQDAGYTTEC